MKTRKLALAIACVATGVIVTAVARSRDPEPPLCGTCQCRDISAYQDNPANGGDYFAYYEIIGGNYVLTTMGVGVHSGFECANPFNLTIENTGKVNVICEVQEAERICSTNPLNQNNGIFECSNPGIRIDGGEEINQSYCKIDMP